MDYTYYINDDFGHLVRYNWTLNKSETLRKTETKWVELPRDNSYEREIFLGQGNNCLTKLTAEEVLDILNRRYFEG